MKKIMYSIYDRVAGVYGDPTLFVNETDMIRRVSVAFRDNPFINDFDIYVIGQFDTETGVFYVFEKPDFIMNMPSCIELFGGSK